MATLKFETEAGEEVPAVTAQEMLELDRIAVEETGPNLWQMMENAGRSLAEFLICQAGADWRAARLLALCGSGGNGGGGYCAARHLLNHGARIRVYSTAGGDLGEVPARQRALFLAAGGEEIEDDAVTREEPTLIIDAMIGYGLAHAPRGRVRKDYVSPFGSRWWIDLRASQSSR